MSDRRCRVTFTGVTTRRLLSNADGVPKSARHSFCAGATCSPSPRMGRLPLKKWVFRECDPAAGEGSARHSRPRWVERFAPVTGR